MTRSLPLLAALASALVATETPFQAHAHEIDATGRAVPSSLIREISSARTLKCGPPPQPGSLAAGVFFGDAIDGPAGMQQALARHEQRYGARPPMVKTFASLEDDFSEDGRAGQLLRALRAASAVTPLVSLEPTWQGSPQTGLLEFLASGQADGRIARVADALAALGEPPVLIELAAEMNARFGAPWQADQNGGEVGPGAYVRAWRHVADVVRAEGAHNVRWVFAPSAGNPYTHLPTGPAHWAWYGHWYPGDSYVDYLGLHAFNDARQQGAWVPFVELVTGDAADRMLGDMIARFPARRIILGELASSEHPGRPGAKARWIEDAYRRMQRCGAIAGAIWFDMDKESDWQLASSQESARAYRASVGEITGPSWQPASDSPAEAGPKE